MEAQEFTRVKTDFMSWLIRLSGGQIDELKAELAQCTSQADCIAIIEERGKKLRSCPHCGGEKLYRHGTYTAFAVPTPQFR
jgi:predicted RNA-binding Zn-ribbon protein involved in translation (DUF1610 family)